MATWETLTVNVPSDLAAALREAVSAGEYADESNAVADALTIWARRHEDRAEDLAWMKAKIRASLADPRPSLTLDQVRERMKTFYAAAEQQDDAAA